MKMNKEKSVREIHLDYLNEKLGEVSQGDFFGRGFLTDEEIVAGYCISLGKKREQWLEIILNDEKTEELLVSILNSIFQKIHSGEKKSDVRLREIEEIAQKSNYKIILQQITFIRKVLKSR